LQALLRNYASSNRLPASWQTGTSHLPLPLGLFQKTLLPTAINPLLQPFNSPAYDAAALGHFLASSKSMGGTPPCQTDLFKYSVLNSGLTLAHLSVYKTSRTLLLFLTKRHSIKSSSVICMFQHPSLLLVSPNTLAATQQKTVEEKKVTMTMNRSPCPSRQCQSVSREPHFRTRPLFHRPPPSTHPNL
jgi:hypothetical protein